MKKLRVFFSKSYAAVVAAVLGLLGFSVASCDFVGGGGDAPVEYGTPSADFVIRGRVSSSENGSAVAGIQITRESRRGYPTDTVYTDELGMYSVSGTDIVVDSVKLKFADVDGVENGGEFITKTEAVVFYPSDFKGGNGAWYQGKAEKELAVKLDKK